MIKWVNAMVYELYLNKAVKKISITKEEQTSHAS